MQRCGSDRGCLRFGIMLMFWCNGIEHICTERVSTCGWDAKRVGPALTTAPHACAHAATLSEEPQLLRQHGYTRPLRCSITLGFPTATCP